MDIKDRVIRFIDHLNIAIDTFESQVGLARGTVNRMGPNTRGATIAKICKRFPEADPDWLKYGLGEMIRKNHPVVDIGDRKVGDNSQYSNNDPELYLKALNEIAAQRKFTEKVQSDLSEAHRQIMELSNRIIEMSKMVNNQQPK